MFDMSKNMGKHMKVTAFCFQKWSSNRAAIPRDDTLVADCIVILVCFFSTTFTTRRAVRNAKFRLATKHFLCVFERDSLRHAECNQNLCNQRDVTIWMKLDPVSG